MKNIIAHDFSKCIKAKLPLQIFSYIIPTLIGVILSSSAIKICILSHVPQWCHDIITKGWVQLVGVFILMFVIPSALFLIAEYKEYKKKKSGYDILLCLITNIDNVVSKKRLRFRTIREEKYKSDQKIFRSITKPDEQIGYLCEAICIIMRFWTNDNDVKSVVFYCKKNKIECTLAVCGEDKIKTSINDLNKKSLAKKALKDGTSYIVDDTEVNDDFIKPKGCNAKSAFVMPIYDGNEVVFVICFTSPNKRCFDKAKQKKYESVIEEISSRMMLEWHLFELLKQGSNA